MQRCVHRRVITDAAVSKAMLSVERYYADLVSMAMFDALNPPTPTPG